MAYVETGPCGHTVVASVGEHRVRQPGEQQQGSVFGFDFVCQCGERWFKEAPGCPECGAGELTAAKTHVDAQSGLVHTDEWTCGSCHRVFDGKVNPKASGRRRVDSRRPTLKRRRRRLSDHAGGEDG